jgi:hypothetical protein
MEIIGRFILRLLLVPLGAAVATCVAVLVLTVAHWNAFRALAEASPQAREDYLLAIFIAGPILAMLLSLSATMTLLPAAIGVLISETFAVRSWLYHTANGGLSAWIGWSLIHDVREEYRLFTEPTALIAAGIAAGFAYWVIAGWSAGFWKPIRQRPQPQRA